MAERNGGPHGVAEAAIEQPPLSRCRVGPWRAFGAGGWCGSPLPDSGQERAPRGCKRKAPHEGSRGQVVSTRRGLPL